MLYQTCKMTACNKMITCPQFILSCLITIRFAIANADNVDDSWSFIVLADWHGAESFAMYPVNNLTDSNNLYYNDTLAVLQYMNKTYGGDLVVLPGDSNNGKWHTNSFRKELNKNLGLSTSTEIEAIAVAGKNCYSTTKRLFSEAGYDQILLAIGDHEIGGDGWSIDSPKLNGLSTFRNSLGRELNEKNEVSIYTEPIGNATSRPIGTPYVNTSYAFIHKDALFVTVDAFHDTGANYFETEKGEGGNGVITCNVVGDHLSWFEDVLREARKDSAIRHIFVQAHVPIIQPVRKINSSGQFFDASTDSDFWKVMQKYSVDVYFGGEVHANTATKDPNSNLLQVISRGNRLNNFLKVDVSNDQLNISAYNEVGTKWIWNANYTKFGEIKIDKSGNETSIQSSGALSILDTSKGPLISLKFERNDTYNLKERQIVGLKYDQFKETLVGHSVTIQDEISTEGMENHGVFGVQYDAQIANIDINEGGLFTNRSRLAIGSMGPMAAGEIISCSLLFKTTTSNESVLIFYGDKWGEVKRKHLYLLTLNNGSPIFYINEKTFLTAKNEMSLNDGSWHSIIVSMPAQSSLLSEVLIYVDNEKMKTEVVGNDEHIFFTTSGHLSLGGWGYSSSVFSDKVFSTINNFEGQMNDFELWHGRVLEPRMTENPSQSPTELSLSEMPSTQFSQPPTTSPSLSLSEMPSRKFSQSPTTYPSFFMSEMPSRQLSQPPTTPPVLGGSPNATDPTSSGHALHNIMTVQIIVALVFVAAMRWI